MARASSPLPVPVSPVIRMLASVAATLVANLLRFAHYCDIPSAPEGPSSHRTVIPSARFWREESAVLQTQPKCRFLAPLGMTIPWLSLYSAILNKRLHHSGIFAEETAKVGEVFYRL